MTRIFTTFASAAIALTLSAAGSAFPWPERSFTNASVERTPTSLVLTMDIHPSAFNLKPNHQAWLRPAIVAQGDTLWLNPVIVAGRTRYFQDLRHGTVPADGVLLRAGSPDSYAYQAIRPYESWMDLCDLVLTGTVTGCCGDGIGPMSPDQPLASCDFRIKELTPQYIYVSPTQEIIKTRADRGEAFIDFPVGKAVILPDFRGNSAELAKIRDTIDKVKSDSDYTITSLDFCGYASPEGSYALNERLARTRTEALIDYVRRLYTFPSDLLHSSWVAEDWQGLATRLEGMEIDDRDSLLAVVRDTTITPDRKDLMLKRDFPAQYAILLADVYPSLRRTDYVITYNVRNYLDISEIAEIISTSPQKLSLAEIFAYAQTLDNSSPEFREVMEVAVRMYPSDPVANLNAATTAVRFGDYDRARAYLAKAPDTPRTAYTAGLLEAMQGNYAQALPLLTRASQAGITEADDILARMRSWGWIQ